MAETEEKFQFAYIFWQCEKFSRSFPFLYMSLILQYMNLVVFSIQPDTSISYILKIN